MTENWEDMFLVDVASQNGSGARQTLSFSRTPTVLLTFAANRFTRQSSKLLQDRFDIGAMDWRMLVMLTRHPGASVAVSSETIGIDKAAISRSLQRLSAKQFVTADTNKNDPRRKAWYLTPKGEALHDEILKTVLGQLSHQLRSFTPQEVADFTRLLEKFHDNL